ncbi:hypothetical protein K3495_g4177 [Podosphaera aphanis]|nr:hypothetical protein K3495_g4177 [Podosphaera aphanis]
MSDVTRHCSENVTLAQVYHSTYGNEKRLSAPRYQPGDRVFLSLKNIALQRPTKKLDHLRAGPWKTLEMKTSLVAKLDLPPQLKIENNFHVSLLRPAYLGYSSQQQKRPPPLEQETGEPNIYEVEAILESRIWRKKVQYLVRWTGYDDTTWEASKNLINCKELLLEFHETYRKAPGSRELASGKRGE